MSKKLTIQDLQKMSNQALIEFMTENIPADKLRKCLQKVEPFPEDPSMNPLAAVEEEEEEEALPSAEKEIDNLSRLRTKCEKYPVIVVKIGPKEGKTGDFVYYYKINDKGNIQYTSVSLETFDKKTCNVDSSNFKDADCEIIANWMEQKITEGKNIEELKATMTDYINNHKADFISVCDNVKELLSKLGISSESLEEEEEEEDEDELPPLEEDEEAQVNNIRQTCTSKGLLIGNFNPKTELVEVFAPQLIDRENKALGYEWKGFNLTLDKIRQHCEKGVTGLKTKQADYQKAFQNTSVEIQNKIKTVVAMTKSLGISIPYNFFEAGGSNDFGKSNYFGEVHEVTSLSNVEPNIVQQFLNENINTVPVLKVKNVRSNDISIPVITIC